MSIFDKSDYGYEDLVRDRGYANLNDFRNYDYGYRRDEPTDSYGETLASMILYGDEFTL